MVNQKNLKKKKKKFRQICRGKWSELSSHRAKQERHQFNILTEYSRHASDLRVIDTQQFVPNCFRPPIAKSSLLTFVPWRRTSM